jgi:hypothetical protein
VQFASDGNDPRIRALVAALDRDGLPAAETWRKVGDAAWRLGFPRPGYHLVHRLVVAERRRRVSGSPVRALGVQAGLALGWSRRRAGIGVGVAVDISRPRLVARHHKPP